MKTDVFRNGFLVDKCISFISLLCMLVLPLAVHAEGHDFNEVGSRYLNKVNDGDYGEVEPPKNAPVFRWDFSKKRILKYSFDQEVVARAEMPLENGNESGDPEQQMSTKGELSIKSQGDGTADLVLSDVKTSVQVSINKSDAPKKMEQAIPAFVVQGMKEDGLGLFGDSSQDMLLKLLFSLPTKTLKVGESVDVPAQMPFNAMGSQLWVKGRSRITLTRYVLVGNRTCAQLNADIEISDLKVPTELEGKYSCSAKGSAVFFFDVNSRCFVSGSTALLMQFSIDAPMPKMDAQEEAAQNLPERMKMSMQSDNYIHVSLQE